MLAANPGKTPISLLQEYGTRIGKTPGYDLLKAEGQAHQPNFTFRVTVGDISCTGGSPTPSSFQAVPPPAPGGVRRGDNLEKVTCGGSHLFGMCVEGSLGTMRTRGLSPVGWGCGG